MDYVIKTPKGRLFKVLIKQTLGRFFLSPPSNTLPY